MRLINPFQNAWKKDWRDSVTTFESFQAFVDDSRGIKKKILLFLFRSDIFNTSLSRWRPHSSRCSLFSTTRSLLADRQFVESSKSDLEKLFCGARPARSTFHTNDSNAFGKWVHMVLITKL